MKKLFSYRYLRCRLRLHSVRAFDGYGYGYTAAPVVTYGYAAAPVVAYGYAAAPVVTYGYAAAPVATCAPVAYGYAAAACPSYGYAAPYYGYAGALRLRQLRLRGALLRLWRRLPAALLRRRLRRLLRPAVLPPACRALRPRLCPARGPLPWRLRPPACRALRPRVWRPARGPSWRLRPLRRPALLRLAPGGRSVPLGFIEAQRPEIGVDHFCRPPLAHPHAT